MDDQESFEQEGTGNGRIADDAVPLCSNCLSECDPKLKYCPNCNETSYLPYGHNHWRRAAPFTFPFGKIWHVFWTRETKWWKRILCLPIIIFFFYPFFIILFIASLFSVGKNKDFKLEK